MMGNKGCIDGAEQDALSQACRHIYHWKAGTRKLIKRKFSKRMRRIAKITLDGDI